ncbi:MAG: FAD:protein FMN transferase [Bacteroidia bacterium]|nr:FAD:protein FMN transferase [Bacteroidia bacterium]
MINKLLSALLLLALLAPACKNKKPVFANFTGFTQGTTYSIVYDNNKNIDPVELRVKVENILHDFDMSLSLYQDSSVISKINRNEEVLPDSFITEVFIKSALISEMTAGAFDITVGPLVKAWGFGPDAHKSFTESKRDSLMKLVGMGKVSLISERLIKSDPGINLDVNAIAQGYSVDILCRYFDNLGILNYLVEIGGEVRAKGNKAGALWRIGIDKPEDNNMSPGQTLQAIVKMADKALATSGNYRKFYIEDGIKYSHEIDPKTGYPAKNTLLSATIIADDCALADGIATACMVMGKEKTIEFLCIHPEFEAYLIYSDANGNFKTWISENLKKYISESEN